LYAGDANFNSMDYDKNVKLSSQRQTESGHKGGIRCLSVRSKQQGMQHGDSSCACCST
jgi:hypothetical protein